VFDTVAVAKVSSTILEADRTSADIGSTVGVIGVAVGGGGGDSVGVMAIVGVGRTLAGVVAIMVGVMDGEVVGTVVAVAVGDEVGVTVGVVPPLTRR